MRGFSKRENIILIVCVCAVIVYGIVQWVVKPLQESKDDIAFREKAAQTKLLKSRALLRKAKALEAQQEKFKAILGTSSASGKEVAQMMSRIESAAGDAKVHIGNMQPLQAVDRGGYRIFSVEITFDGPWASITKFFHAVQDNSNLFKIEELNLERYSDTTESLRGRAVLSRIRLAS